MTFPNYEYAETENKNIEPDGDGWEYWADRITPGEHVAVWRRIVENETETETVE